MWSDARLLIDKTGLEHRRPETITRVCEMHARCDSPKTGIDTYDQQPATIAYQIRKAEALEPFEVSPVERHDCSVT